MESVDLTSVQWRTSSYSSGNGQCVEVGQAWRTSSYSGGNGQCVEVAPAQGVMAIRDSKDPAGPVLGFSPDAWAAFVGGVAVGDFGEV